MTSLRVLLVNSTVVLYWGYDVDGTNEYAEFMLLRARTLSGFNSVRSSITESVSLTLTLSGSSSWESYR